MKSIIQLAVACAAILISQLPVSAQGTFQNLDFESANLPILSPGQSGGFVPVSSALPGWNAFLSTNQQSSVLYNTATFGSAAIWIVGPNFQFWNPMEGNFTVALTAGGSVEKISASISQTATVPTTARSIQAKVLANTPDFVFSLDGTAVNMFPITTTPEYILYGGDIASFAGQNATLRITAPPTLANPSFGFRLDSIVFSDQSIPEPGTISLLLVGLGVMGFRFWKTSARNQ